MAIVSTSDVEIDVRPRDLLRKISLSEQRIDLNIEVPDSFFQTLIEQLLERDYLNDTAGRTFAYDPHARPANVQWLQVERLPVHPADDASYDLLSRWQGVLSSLHAWG